MLYKSTRGQSPEVSFTQAVAQGLAPDGGLYVPADLPSITDLLPTWENADYITLATDFFALFDTDHSRDEIHALVKKSYSNFSNPKTAPLVQLTDDLHVLELFHGQTLAFKDFGLQFLGNLYEDQIARTGTPINVLGATSGDTGSAAIHGLLGREGVNIFILYPKGRTSALQERQMTCTGASNVYPLSIIGSFDDAQAIVKQAFADHAFAKDVGLSAINSINLARILAQSVYYIAAWLQLPQEKRNNVEFIVPTGNFGNVLAGWLAQKMGLPVKQFQIATNQNDILHRLFSSGDYSQGDVLPSLAPSMDIQAASNFERFLYYASGKDSEKVRTVMQAIKENASYTFSDFDPDSFRSSRTTDAEIKEIIERIHQDHNYIADPHTACGFTNIDPNRTSIVLATAHPAKFPDTIEDAIHIHPTHESLEALKEKEPITYPQELDCESIKAFVREKAQKTG